MEKDVLELNGRSLQIHDAGEAEKGVIVGIHGLTGNAMQLDYYRKQFSPDYRFITMDLYGRGNSKAGYPENDIFKHAEDILSLIETLELKDVILMGYSMGGFIAAIVASQTDRVKAVVLLDGAATMSEHQRPIVEPSLGRLSKHFDSKEQYITEVSDGYENLGIEKSKELEEVLAYEIEDHGDYWENKASEVVVRTDWESFWEFNVAEIGPNISQPVLLVQASGGIGKNPPLFLPEHYEDTIQHISNIEVVTSDSNHYTMVFENRDDINQYVSDFLNKL